MAKAKAVRIEIDERKLALGSRRARARAEAAGWAPGTRLEVDIRYPRPRMVAMRKCTRRLEAYFGKDLAIVVKPDANTPAG